MNVEAYRENRDLLYNNLTEYGYQCVKPDGAFYLFVKALEEDAYRFFERAKAHEILVVPCDDLPKSFVLTSEYGFTRVRLTSLNSATLEKRLK